MVTFDEFEDMVNDFILDNAYADGEEIAFKRHYKDNLKKLYEELK